MDYQTMVAFMSDARFSRDVRYLHNQDELVATWSKRSNNDVIVIFTLALPVNDDKGKFSFVKHCEEITPEILETVSHNFRVSQEQLDQMISHLDSAIYWSENFDFAQCLTDFEFIFHPLIHDYSPKGDEDSISLGLQLP